jgi:hypothetical protein
MPIYVGLIVLLILCVQLSALKRVFNKLCGTNFCPIVCVNVRVKTVINKVKNWDAYPEDTPMCGKIKPLKILVFK